MNSTADTAAARASCNGASMPTHAAANMAASAVAVRESLLPVVGFAGRICRFMAYPFVLRVTRILRQTKTLCRLDVTCIDPRQSIVRNSRPSNSFLTRKRFF
jgi:hypothetical protein